MSLEIVIIARVLATEIANPSGFSSSLLEVVKILAISSAWIGGLIL